MVSRFQPLRLMPPIMLFAALCALSYWIDPAPWHHLSMTSKALISGTILVLIGLMVGLRGRSWLRIDDRGIEIRYGFGAPRTFAWDDVVAARTARKRIFLVPVMSMVHLQLHTPAGNAVRRAANVVNGYDASLPAFFDLSAEEIVERIQFHLKQRVA